MSHFKKYLSYRLRSTAFQTLIITIIATVLACSTIAVEAMESSRKVLEDPLSPRVSSGAEVLIWITIALAVLFPILETYMLKSGKTLDVVFSLPVKRTSIAWAHYLSGLISFTFTTAVTFLSSAILLLISAKNFYVSSLLPMYIWLFIYSVIIYSIVIFLFSRGNTLGDGLVFTFLYILALYVMATMLDQMIRSNEFFYRVYSSGMDGLPNYLLRDYFGFIGLISETAENYIYLLERRPDVSCFDLRTALENIFYDVGPQYGRTTTLITFILWALAGIASAVAFIPSLEKYRAEKAGDISDSFFGYRFIIPAIGLPMIVLNNGLILVETIIAIGMLIGYFIYRRSFRIKIEDIFTIMLGIVLMMPV